MLSSFDVIATLGNNELLTWIFFPSFSSFSFFVHLRYDKVHVHVQSACTTDGRGLPYTSRNYTATAIRNVIILTDIYIYIYKITIIRVIGQYNGSDILAQTIVFTVIIIVIIIVVVPPPMYNNIVEKNNKNCTACTSCSAAFRYAITGGGFLVLAIGSSAAAIFRLYVVQHRLQCTYYYYYYHYVYIV